MRENIKEYVVADWKFDSGYFKEGSLEENNLVIGDASGNGNDLKLNVERVPQGRSAGDFMRFAADNIFGDSETESLWMEPLSVGNAGKKAGAFWETVPEAPVNQEEFRGGYTIEIIMKLPKEVSPWSSVVGRKGTGKLAEMTGTEPEAAWRTEYF